MPGTQAFFQQSHMSSCTQTQHCASGGETRARTDGENRKGWKTARQMVLIASVCLPPHTAQCEHLVSRAESEESGKLLREKHS